MSITSGDHPAAGQSRSSPGSWLQVAWKRCAVHVEIPPGHAESLLGRTPMELNDDLDEACDKAMREACPAANTGSGTPPSSLRRPSNNWGMTGPGISNLLDVRLGRAAAQDDPRGQRPDRLGQADPLGQPAAQQVGLPRRSRLPRGAGPAKRNDRPLILRPARVRQVPGMSRGRRYSAGRRTDLESPAWKIGAVAAGLIRLDVAAGTGPLSAHE